MVIVRMPCEWHAESLSTEVSGYDSLIRGAINERDLERSARHSFYSHFERFLVKFINLSRDTAGRYRGTRVPKADKHDGWAEDAGSRSEAGLLKDDSGRIFCQKPGRWRNISRGLPDPPRRYFQWGSPCWWSDGDFDRLETDYLIFYPFSFSFRIFACVSCRNRVPANS